MTTIDVQEFVPTGEITVVEVLIPGVAGPAPELRVEGTILQYQAPPSTVWIDLFDFATLGGFPSAPGGVSLNFSIPGNSQFIPLISEF